MKSTKCLSGNFSGLGLGRHVSGILSWLCFTLLWGLPLIANAAQFSYDYWWTEGHKVTETAVDGCEKVYELTGSMKSNYQFCIDVDGTNMNATNMNIADDATSSFSFKTGDDGVYSALVYSGTDDLTSVTFYLSLEKDATDKYTLSLAKPSIKGISIKGTDYENLTKSSTSKFASVYCSTDDATFGGTYQWQYRNLGETDWTDVAGETLDELSVFNAKDSTSYRVLAVEGTDTMVSNSLTVSYATPSISFELTGGQKFNSYEYECDFGTSMTATISEVSGLIEPTSYTLRVMNADSTFTDVMTSTTPEFSFTPSSNYEWYIVAKGNDLRTGHEGGELEVSGKFFVRVRYSGDQWSVLDTLWYDDFGRFDDATTFIINGMTFDSVMVDTNTVKNQIASYWAPDYYGSVLNHEFALNDPLVGDNTPGECASLGYHPYRCWSNGYRVEDGFYAIMPNPYLSNGDMPDKDYWYGTDHSYLSSGDNNGGMLFVNCIGKSYNTVIYERTIEMDQSCDNTQLLFNAYINNASAKAGNAPVNVRLDVRTEDGTLIASVPSGDIYPRPEAEYDPEVNYWANLSYVFTSVKGESKYILQLVNNVQADGDHTYGNDLLFDDITISIRYPNVEVFASRDIDNDKPVETCEEGVRSLYALNRNGITKYIANPLYLFQYRKSADEPWKNLEDGVVEYDSININLTKQDSRFWGYTYIRAIVASSQDVIDSILVGKTPALSCSSVYAIDSSYVVYFGYQGPMGTDYVDNQCVGQPITITGSAPGRTSWRWVDSKDTTKYIAENENSLTFVMDSISQLPTDTVFFFVGVDSLGCTDTQKVTVHRKPISQFTVPTLFSACYNASEVQLTNLVPASQTFAWTVNGTPDATNTTSAYTINEPTPVVGTTKGTIIVTGNGDPNDYCEQTKSFEYEIHYPINLTLTTDRTDTLFCIAQSDNYINFKATVTQGAAVNYYWYADEALTGVTEEPVNTFTFPITEGSHTYRVSAVDGVCNVFGLSEAGAKMNIEARNPIVITLTPDRTTICEGESINVAAKVDNVLVNPTQLTWVPSANAAVASVTTVTDENSASANVVTPTSTTDFTEDFAVGATTTDEVCPNNNPAQTIFFKLNKNMKIMLTADGITDKKCVAEAGDEFASLHITVLRGNPTSYTWSDGTIGTVLDRDWLLSVGDNNISVVANDEVCSSQWPEATSSMSIRVRTPLTLSLDLAAGANPACVNSSVSLDAKVGNVYDTDMATVAWSPAYWGTKTVAAGDDIETLSPITSDKLGSNTITVYAIEASADPVCPAVSASYTLYVQDSVHLTLEAPVSLCQTVDSTETTSLIATITQGSPYKLVWSTGAETLNPGTVEELVINPTQTAYYSVYAVDDVCGNSNAVASVNPVNVSTYFDVNITAEQEEVAMSDSVRLHATPSIPYNGIYAWYKNEALTSGNAAYNALMEDMGSYTYYTVVDEGYCGLVRSNDVEVIVGDFKIVPNAFTPRNQNPKNNVFMKGYTVEIYNRYQQLVFKGDDGWDGSYNGGDADPGTYFYRLQKKDGRVLKGTIELVKF